VQFFLYDALKGYWPQVRSARFYNSSDDRPRHTTITPLQAFVTGALAKAVATVLTYPLQVAQTVLRMQQVPSRPRQPTRPEEQQPHDDTHDLDAAIDSQVSPRLPQPQQYQGMWDCLVKVYRRDGMPGLFTGMQAKLLQTVLTAAFTFLTYEQIVAALFATHQAVWHKQKHQRLG
jgi:solute carrier family 25 (peroxisomal adenine nucleotide transporter), member 17